MPIEFRCGQCDQLLTVPESAAGKNARCPKCESLLAVPPSPESPPIEQPQWSSSVPPEPPPPEPAPPPIIQSAPVPLPFLQTSRPSQQRLARPSSRPAGAFSLPSPDNPYVAPRASTHGSYPHDFDTSDRPGLPWDNEKPSLRCWFRTTGMILGSPTYAFSIMRQYGGLGSAMLYNFYGIALPAVVGMAVVVPILMILMLAVRGRNGPEAAGNVLILAGTFAVFAAFYILIHVTLYAFLSAAIYHVLLMIVGGARHGYETTFRTFSYTQGAVFWCLLIPIPYLNALLLGVWQLVLFIIGMARAHETTGVKVALAIFLPMIVCGGLAIVFVFLILAAAIGAGLLSR